MQLNNAQDVSFEKGQVGRATQNIHPHLKQSTHIQTRTCHY